MRFIRCGKVASHFNAIRSALTDAASVKATIAAIETPKGSAFTKARSAQVNATSVVAGDIAGTARERGFVVFQAACQDVRRALCGRGILGPRGPGSAGDRAVRLVLPRYVSNLPKRMNSHERDALLVAVLALLNPGMRGS